MPHALATATEMPLVSVVVNNYNYGRFLRAAIDGALRQTYAKVEVIVVDDGSTDDSREIIASYENRVMPVLKKNGGQASALNAGFSVSRGDLVIFLDSDDELLPGAITEVVKAWRPGIAKIQYQLEMVDEQGRYLNRRVPHFRDFVPNGDLRDRIRSYGEYPSAPLSGNAYSRQALSRIMPLDEPEWLLAADKPLFLLAPFFGSVVSLCVPLGHYRIHGKNDSRLKGRYLEALHRRLTASFFIPDTISEFAARRGIELDLKMLRSTLRRVKLRMISLRLAQPDHPIGTDTRFRVMLEGIRAAAREPNLTLAARISHVAWFLLMAVSTRKVAVQLSEPSR